MDTLNTISVLEISLPSVPSLMNQNNSMTLLVVLLVAAACLLSVTHKELEKRKTESMFQKKSESQYFTIKFTAETQEQLNLLELELSKLNQQIGNLQHLIQEDRLATKSPGGESFLPRIETAVSCKLAPGSGPN